MTVDRILRGPLLTATDSGVDFHADGCLAAAGENIAYAGSFAAFRGPERVPIEPARGTMLPPLLDIHIHIPQHPIRGDFVKGVPDDAPEGRLLAGLKKNVFPAEARCNDPAHAEAVVRQFQADTLAHGVVGGAAYMTSSAAATEAAFSILPDTWSVGLVLMNQHCPSDLCTNESQLTSDIDRIAARFGRRLIVTDRFAVAVDSPLRRKAAALAERHGLRTQTHLNEQLAEKAFVETALYPGYDSYTDVYRRDGLLDHDCIVAHCIQMSDAEWEILAETQSVVAHCPTSNLHLGSGVMDLDTVVSRGLAYAIATDVGASPTVSMLAEMKRFLLVHKGSSAAATPAEALRRATREPAKLLELGERLGRLEPGRPLSFIEVESPAADTADTAEAAILALLPADMDRPTPTVNRVTVAGEVLFERAPHHA